MKVLHLFRQHRGGAWNFAKHLQSALLDRGTTVELFDAQSFIPNETGPRVDKEVSAWLRNQGQEFDLVHAWGYRAAWACATTYSDREAWVYYAYDMPKTTHRLLIANLNLAQQAMCSSRGVFRALDESLAMNLEIVHPAVPPGPLEIDRAAARKNLGIAEDAYVVGGIGSFRPEKGFASLIEAFPSVVYKRENSLLVLAGEGPEKENLSRLAEESSASAQIRFLPWQEDPTELYTALDLLAVPSLRAGFSLAALEAMAVGTPAMVRDTGGLREIVDPDVSGFLVKDDSEMTSLLTELADLPPTLESVGHGARIRALDQFTVERAADRVLDVYERALGVR